MPGAVAVLLWHTHTWHGGCAHLHVLGTVACPPCACVPPRRGLQQPELSRVFVRCQELHLVACCCWKTCMASAGICQIMSCGCDRAHHSACRPGTVCVCVLARECVCVCGGSSLQAGGSQLNAPEHVG